MRKFFYGCAFVLGAFLVGCGGDSYPDPICLLPAKANINAEDCIIPRIGPTACEFPLRDTVYIVDGVDHICCQVIVDCPKRPRLGGAP